MKRLLLGIVVVAALVAAMWIAREEVAQSPSSHVQASAQAAPADASSTLATMPAAREAIAVAMPTASSPPLPPPDAPVAAVYAQLKPRADAGDAPAACRLAFELIRCDAYGKHLDDLQHHLRMREQELATLKIADFREGANEVAEQQARLLRLADECKALPPGATDAGDEYLYRAARAGNLEATVRYIDGQGLGLVGTHTDANPDASFLRHPGFDRWRREAPRFAQGLLAAHRTQALFLYVTAYGSDESPFDGLVADDPVRAYAYMQVHRQLLGLPAQPDTLLPPAQRPVAAALIRRMLDEGWRHVEMGQPPAVAHPAVYSDGHEAPDCR